MDILARKQHTKRVYCDIQQFAPKQKNSPELNGLKAFQHSAKIEQCPYSTVLISLCFQHITFRTLILEYCLQHIVDSTVIIAQCFQYIAFSTVLICVFSQFARIQPKYQHSQRKNSTDISAVSARFSISDIMQCREIHTALDSLRKTSHYRVAQKFSSIESVQCGVRNCKSCTYSAIQIKAVWQ